MTKIALAQTEKEIRRCHPVMVELRPHLSEAVFTTQVQRQQQTHGYALAFLGEDGEIKAVAGFRVSECLAWGRFLYVDDLVTLAAARSKGYGRQLIDWLVAQAHSQGCAELHLDSGIQRIDAHRFYRARRMDLTCHHFALKLE